MDKIKHNGLFAALSAWNSRRKSARAGKTGIDKRKWRIALIAIMLGVVSAVIDLPLPAEEAFRAVRAELRTRPAPDNIVVVAIDNATLNELKTDRPTRLQHAALVNKVFELGAERLVFDKAFADPATVKEDEAFAKVLRKHHGKVWLGTSPAESNGVRNVESLIPTARLRDSAATASMVGMSSPFRFATYFPTHTIVEGQDVPSISAVLASHRSQSQWYRVDFAYDPKTIPTLSYGDVLSGRISKEALNGKRVIVGRTYLRSDDMHSLPLGGSIPGPYFHVIGAHTLNAGIPLDLAWYPAFLIVIAVIACQMLRRRPSRLITIGASLFLALAPLVLDTVGVIVDIFPAAIALFGGIFGLSRLASRTYNHSTNQVLPDAIHDAEIAPGMDIYALKIENLGDFAEASSPRELGKFVDQIISYLQEAGPDEWEGQKVAFDKDTLIWFAHRLTRNELEGHGLGLVTLLKNAVSQTGGLTHIEATLGIDINYDLSTNVRVQNATQAAELGSRGRMRFVIADSTFLTERKRRLSVLSELERGITEQTIGIGYQPKIDLASGRVIGAEALLRWHHNEMGYIDPQELVSAAEQHRRIDELTFYVIERVLREVRPVLNDNPSFKVAINLSAQTLANNIVLYHMARLLHLYNFPASNLIVEVTETARLDDDAVEGQIAGLLEQGISLSIDDFGTGHSNLDYLRRVPSSELKIDRRFIKPLCSSQGSAVVVKGTIDMAHSLGKLVVAEGVEDQETAERLRKMGCDVAQGFLYSPALHIAEFQKFLKMGQVAA